MSPKQQRTTAETKSRPLYIRYVIQNGLASFFIPTLTMWCTILLTFFKTMGIFISEALFLDILIIIVIIIFSVAVLFYSRKQLIAMDCSSNIPFHGLRKMLVYFLYLYPMVILIRLVLWSWNVRILKRDFTNGCSTNENGAHPVS